MATKVGVFSLGYGAPTAEGVCRLLSGLPGPFQFEHCSAIDKLGRPDLFGYAYSDHAFDALIKPHTAPYDVVAVLTAVPIENNFFTRTAGGRLIISTCHQAEEMMIRAHRSREEYGALALCQELVSFEFQRVSGLKWNDLFHEDPRGCLFDFAGIKEQKIGKLIHCSICDECVGKLAGANVNRTVVAFANSVLRRVRRPSLWHALRLCMTAPYVSFVYGGVVIGAAVNLLSSLLVAENGLTPRQTALLVGFTGIVVLFPLLVWATLAAMELRRRFR